jgi:hypothetical protein
LERELGRRGEGRGAKKRRGEERREGSRGVDCKMAGCGRERNGNYEGFSAKRKGKGRREI